VKNKPELSETCAHRFLAEKEKTTVLEKNKNPQGKEKGSALFLQENVEFQRDKNTPGKAYVPGESKILPFTKESEGTIFAGFVKEEEGIYRKEEAKGRASAKEKEAVCTPNKNI